MRLGTYARPNPQEKGSIGSNRRRRLHALPPLWADGSLDRKERRLLLYCTSQSLFELFA